MSRGYKKIAVCMIVMMPLLFVFKAQSVPLPRQIMICKPTATGEKTVPEPVPRPVAQKKTEKKADAATAAYQKSLRAYNQKKYDRAVSLFKAFIDKYPQHPLAENASYWSAECFYAKSDFAGAVFLFKKMIKEYPQGNKVPDALLKIAYAYLLLNKPQEAKPFLEKVMREYPSQAVSVSAEKKLKTLSP